MKYTACLLSAASFDHPSKPSSTVPVQVHIMSTADELMGPDAISHAIGAAEAGALAESWDEAYFLNKGFQYLIQSFHAASGTPWYA